MTLTDPLFPEWDEASHKESIRRRDEAMGRADDHASPTFKAAALQAIRYVALRREAMTTDPVWRVLQTWGVAMPHEPRALGPLMLSAVRYGWLRKTDRTRNSVLPDCHGRPKAVYVSLLYQPAQVAS
jgi:hypothetical protein